MAVGVKVTALLFLFYVLTFVASAGPAGEVVRMKNETLNLSKIQINSTGPTNSVGPRFLPTFGRVYYIVQFTGPIQEQWKTDLKKAGIEIGSYLPDDAYLVRVNSPNAWKFLSGMKSVRAVAPYKSTLRLSQDFQTIIAQPGANQGNQKIAIRLAFADEAENVIRVAHQRGIPFVLKNASDKNLVIETRGNQVENLADIEGVEWVEPLVDVKFMDFDVSLKDGAAPPPPVLAPGAGDYKDLVGNESGTKLMNFDGAYRRGLHGEGEIVGIADSGLDRGSAVDLLADFKGEFLKGYALGLFSKSWQDPQGHGTHTSGSIVGSGAMSGSKLHGGAPAAKLVMQSMWSPMLKNLSITPDFDKIFGQSYREDGIHIHSDSWGSPRNPGNYDNMAAQVDELSWKYPDLLIIFAAGNEGVDEDQDGRIDANSIGSPATAKNCLTVGASKNYLPLGGVQKVMKDLHGGEKNWGVDPLASSKLSDNGNGLAAFSSRGPTTDGRIKPEIVAPGTNILSTRSRHPQASPQWGIYNDFYVYAGGTSMSTPLTAGAAALVRQNLRRLGYSDPSAALIKAVLLFSATDLYPGQFGFGAGQELLTPRPNSDEGFGRVNVDEGTNLTGVQLNDEPVGLKTGATKEYGLHVKKGDVVRATLVYTDAPAAASAAKTLVNDLDLIIVDDQGQTHYPNHLSGPDRVNNTEMVEFTAGSSGTYMIVVSAHSVPQGRGDTGAQPYALVLR